MKQINKYKLLAVDDLNFIHINILAIDNDNESCFIANLSQLRITQISHTQLYILYHASYLFCARYEDRGLACGSPI